MPYYNYKGRRESNIIHSETFKSVVEEFLNVRGYIKQNDSAIDGCLTDMIFKNRELDGDIETHVEIKWADFSVNNKKIRNELNDYMQLFFNTPEKHRFKFFIYVRNVINEPFHVKIFEKLDDKAITDFYNNVIKDLKTENNQFVEKLSIEDFKLFLWNTSLINTNLESLKMKIFEITKEYPIDENIFLRYSSLEEKDNIVKSEEIIYSNLVKLDNLFNMWHADSIYSTLYEIKAKVNFPPPFYLYEGKIISLYPFEYYNCLSDVINKETIRKIYIDDWSQNEDKRNVIVALLNRAIDRLCQLRGLYKTREGKPIYYFPNLSGYKERRTQWEISEKTKEKGKIIVKKRKSSRIVYKKYAEKSHSPYFLHIGVMISAVWFDNEYYFSFLPAKVFTRDGVKQTESERTIFLEGKYRNPRFSYNRNLLLEQLFWGYYIFSKADLKQTKLKYKNERIEEIKFHTIKLLNFLGMNGFETLKIDSKPKIKDDKKDEDEVSVLDSIFNEKIMEETE